MDREGTHPQAGKASVEEVLGAQHRWYHTIELSPGVVTPGWIDLRSAVRAAGIPDDLSGMRALDVGAFDGFWAFELERRGADVVAIDIDEIPPPDTPEMHRARLAAEAKGLWQGTGFTLLKSYFHSSVERVSLNVYDLEPSRVGGPVDFVFVGSLLLHLRDPVRALERIRSTLSSDGLLICFEPTDRRLSRRRKPFARYMGLEGPWTWWLPNTMCLKQWASTAGFTNVSINGKTTVVDVEGGTHHLAALHARP